MSDQFHEIYLKHKYEDYDTRMLSYARDLTNHQHTTEEKNLSLPEWVTEIAAEIRSEMTKKENETTTKKKKKK